MAETARVRKAWSLTHPDSINPSTAWASTPARAKAQYCADLDGYRPFGEIVRSLRCRRDPARDKIIPPRHPLAGQLAPRLLGMIVHAYGGTGDDAGWRGHYYTDLDDTDMQALVYHTIFEPSSPIRDGYRYYTLTSLGRRIAAGEQPQYPHETTRTAARARTPEVRS